MDVALTLFVAKVWLKQLVAGPSFCRVGLYPALVHLGFVSDKMAVGQVFSEYFHFPFAVLFHHWAILILSSITATVYSWQLAALLVL
jgi:hypothetical protein